MCTMKLVIQCNGNAISVVNINIAQPYTVYGSILLAWQRYSALQVACLGAVGDGCWHLKWC